MIKNRTTQLIYQTIYCTLAILGFAGSLGYFAGKFNGDFYVFYTNLSNYICFGFMFASIVFTIKAANKKEQGYVTFAPKFKFMCNILILVTCLVYNFLLAQYEHTFSSYFLAPANVLNHLVLPIMFVLDWILFYEHGKTKWYYPLLCVIMPLIYVIYVLIRAAIVGANYAGTIYPYFFLDVATLGWGGFIKWILILLVVFVALGYMLFLYDNISNFRKNRKK